MLQSEDIAHSAKNVKEAVVRTTDDVGGIRQTTEEFEQLPRIDSHRRVLSGRRAAALHRQQTDALPQVNSEAIGTRSDWRQAVHLREENMRMRIELEEKQSELQQWMRAYNEAEAEFEKQTAIVHNGYQQEIDQYQEHLRAMMEERNRLQEAHHQSEQRYQELYHTFQDAVEEEARKVLLSRTAAPVEEPAATPEAVQDAVAALDMQTRQQEKRHLMEALYLKSELRYMAEQLDVAHQHLEEERQRLLAMQQTAREQAELRQKTLYARLRSRWRFTSIMTTGALIGLLVVLQFVFLFLFRVSVIGSLSLALLAPIVLCIILILTFSQPYKAIKQIYHSAPHRKKS